jgi:hypothetical protein
MEQYIKKSAVLAEIRKYKNNAEAYLKYHHNRNDKSVYAFEQEKLAMCELLSSLNNLEVQEEPVSEDKMTISKEWFEHCKKSWYNEGYIDGEYNRDRQFEEPLNEELEDFAKRQADEFAEHEYEVDSYDRGCLSKGYYWGCKDGAKWQLAKNKSITLDDLGEFINELSKQFPEVSFAKVCKIATRTTKWLMLNSKLEENV